MSVYDENLVNLPELKDIGDWLKSNSNDFLSSIYNNSSRYILSSKQVFAAKNAWEKIKDPPVYITIEEHTIKTLRFVFENYMARTYYNTMSILENLLYKAEDYGKLTQKQYDSMIASFYKFRKSIIKKIFGNYK